MHQWTRHWVVIYCTLQCLSNAAGEPWVRHTIDRSSRGADGVRLADVTGDRQLDITTG